MLKDDSLNGKRIFYDNIHYKYYKNDNEEWINTETNSYSIKSRTNVKTTYGVRYDDWNIDQFANYVCEKTFEFKENK